MSVRAGARELTVRLKRLEPTLEELEDLVEDLHTLHVVRVVARVFHAVADGCERGSHRRGNESRADVVRTGAEILGDRLGEHGLDPGDVAAHLHAQFWVGGDHLLAQQALFVGWGYGGDELA